MTTFDPYYKWLGIPPQEQPPDHYRLLGLRRFEPDTEVIEAATDRLVAYLQTVAGGEHVAESQRLLNEVAAARRCLVRADSRAAYDAELRQRQAEAQPAEPPPPPPPMAPPPVRGGQLGRASDRAASSVGTARRGRSATKPTAWLLPLAALGLAVALLVGGAVLAWGLRASPERSAAERVRQRPAAPVAETSAQPVSRQAAAPAAESPLSLAPPRSAPAAMVSGWQPSQPEGTLASESGALVLDRTGAVTMDVPTVPGPVTLEVRAGCDGGGMARVWWTVVGSPQFTQERSVDLPLAADEQWQVRSVELPILGQWTRLRIDPPEGRARLELDYVYVFNSDGKKIKTWGFGAGGGKTRKSRSAR